MVTVPTRQDTVNHVDDRGSSRTPAGDALSALWVRVFLLDGLFSAVGDALAKPAGQTSARWQVLAALEADTATVAQIARRLRLARQSVQRVADLLERDGLAAFVDNPRHRRAKLLELTGAGRHKLDAIPREQRAWADALGAEIGIDDLLRACATLDRVIEAIARGPGQAAAR